jgi:hypothetical protein
VTVPVLILGTGTQAKPELVECSATLARRPLRGRGAGRCTFAIPPKTAGKTLRLTVDVDYGNAEKRRVVSLRVRRQ